MKQKLMKLIKNNLIKIQKKINFIHFQLNLKILENQNKLD